MTQPTDQQRERVVDWLSRRVVADARGDRESGSDSKPADRFWLGRLAPEDLSWRSAMGERGQRLDPCSCGFRFRPTGWSWTARVGFRVWEPADRGEAVRWFKRERVEVRVPVAVPAAAGTHTFGAEEIATELAAHGIANHSARLDVTVEPAPDASARWDVTLVVVNQSAERRGVDANLYEVRLELEVGPLEPIFLDAMPDSFRYDRRVDAFGVYGGFRYDDRVLTTTDVVVADKRRPDYWDVDAGPEPDLSFERLADDPLAELQQMVEAHEAWGSIHWSDRRLAEREAEERWSPEIRRRADEEADRFAGETGRLRAGLEALGDPLALRAFKLMNLAFVHSARHARYEGWRAFQLGFLLSVLPSLLDPEEERRSTVDTLWFATGGGKTETYLAAVVLLCLHDRMTGKAHGVTAWSRFPLRMLSLQQTQRFADALAGAERVRRAEGIGGDPIALGFLVGGPPNGTPNRIRDHVADGETDANDRDMPRRHRVLLHCPFCFSNELQMRFHRERWCLEHVCGADGCPWGEAALPFHCVDEEIYRFLPSVVVGTLDKAASIAIQAAMRGLYGAPLARCRREGHGFTYMPRKRTPSGCLVPDCDGQRVQLGQERERFAPGLRIQDELHLLRDSLGAIDSHYETLLDHLQSRSGGSRAKLIASSATLAGYEAQTRELYGREGAVFPLPGPARGVSFWTRDTEALARRFVGLAPRGQTLEFANDRIAESLQRAVRSLIEDPRAMCAAIGIPVEAAEAVVEEYGTHVVYGTKVRDVEAAARSFETQPGVTPLHAVQLTGRTPLEEVRSVLERLQRPERDFLERIHVVAASSMISHGVDVDRFNVITMLGLPLATAEFIQTTARIGRRHPGLVLVLHRMGVERDSSVFRAFGPYVEQGDRFIEPVAITRHSKRVLAHTFAGMFMARVLGIHEPRWHARTGRSLVVAQDFRAFNQGEPAFEEAEFRQLCDALAIDPDGDDPLVEELREHVRLTMRQLNDVASSARLTSQAMERAPMLSLREVETSIPIISRGGG